MLDVFERSVGPYCLVTITAHMQKLKILKRIKKLN